MFSRKLYSSVTPSNARISVCIPDEKKTFIQLRIQEMSENSGLKKATLAATVYVTQQSRGLIGFSPNRDRQL